MSTPSYLADAVDNYEALLAAHSAMESQTPCVMPLLRRPCQLALHARMTEVLNVSRDAQVPAALQRVALGLRQPPRPRLTT